MIICVASRGLKGYEKNYSTTELELLAIVYPLEKFRQYVWGYPIYLYSDNQALVYLRKCEHTNARIRRWAMAIEPFNMTIRHVKGSENAPADYHSRNMGEGREKKIGICEVIIAALNKMVGGGVGLARRIGRETIQDQDLKKIFDLLGTGRHGEVLERKIGKCRYRSKDGLIFKVNPKVRKGWV